MRAAVSEIQQPVDDQDRPSEFEPVTWNDECIEDWEARGDDSEDESLVGDVAFVLSALMFHEAIYHETIKYLSEEMFIKDQRPTFKFIRDFVTENGMLPDHGEVFVRTGMQVPRFESYEPEDERTIDRLQREVKKIIKAKVMETNVLHAVDDPIDEAHFRTVLTETFDHLDDIGAPISSKPDLLDSEFFSNVLHWNEEFAHDLTGFPLLDETINVTKPSINIVSASSGLGKSWYLLNQAYRYARAGKNVLLFSLELSEFEALSRMIQIITELPMEDIREDPDGAHRLIQRRLKRSGKIEIVELPMNSSSCLDLESRMHQIERQKEIKIDYVLVDHLDHLIPISDYKVGDIHDRDKKTTADLLNFAKRHDLVIWTASQQVKSAANEAKARSDSLSGGADKTNISSNVVVLKKLKTNDDHQVLAGTVVKGRSGGTDTVVPFRFCSSTGRISTPDSLRPLFEELNKEDDGGGDRPKSRTKNPTKAGRASEEQIKKRIGARRR